MKKNYFIYILLLCLITTSCENIVLEEEIPITSATTKSTPEELNYYGSNFLDPSYSNEEAFAFISVNPIGAEYSFNLATIADNPNNKSLVSVVGGHIIYKGSDVGSQINGVSGMGMVRFTVKFTSTMAKVTLALKGAMPDSKRNSVRLSIDLKKYNGIFLPLPAGDPINSDLVLGQLP